MRELNRTQDSNLLKTPCTCSLPGHVLPINTGKQLEVPRTVAVTVGGCRNQLLVSSGTLRVTMNVPPVT